MSKFLAFTTMMFTAFVLVLSLSACGQERAPMAQSAASADTQVAKPVEAEVIECIDVNKITPNRMCTMDYTPVCGCDGKTYSNACAAMGAGVTSWVKGACAGAATE